MACNLGETIGGPDGVGLFDTLVFDRAAEEANVSDETELLDVAVEAKLDRVDPAVEARLDRVDAE